NRPKNRFLNLSGVFLSLQVGDETFTTLVYFRCHVLISCGRKHTLSKSAKAVDMETFHLQNGHILRPQVDTQRVFLLVVPKGNGNGFCLRQTCIGLVGSVPKDFGGYIFIVEFYFKLNSRFLHVRLASVSKFLQNTIIFLPG